MTGQKKGKKNGLKKNNNWKVTRCVSYEEKRETRGNIHIRIRLLELYPATTNNN